MTLVDRLPLARPKEAEFARAAARTGLAARAITYGLLAYLTFDVAVRGSSPAPPSDAGALGIASRQPGGTGLVATLAVGFLAYAAWRCLQAFGRDTGPERMTAWKRLGWLGIAAVYVGLAVQAISQLAGSGGSQGPANHPQSFVARALSWPGGRALVTVASLAIGVGGIALAVWGCAHDYRRTMQPGISPRNLAAAHASGVAGQVTRGLWLVLIAGYLFASSFDARSNQARGAGAALESLARWPAGPYLLAIGSVGLLGFAVFSAYEVVFRRV